MELPVQRDALDEILFQALRAIYQFERQKVSRFGLTFGEIYLLQFLRRHASCTVSDIAAEMKIPISTLSRLIARLQKRELLDRRQAATDRRIVEVSLTSKGHDIVKGVEEHTFELLVNNLSDQSQYDLAAFFRTAAAFGKILKPL